MKGFPGGISGKESSCQCRRHKRLRFDPRVRKIPWRRTWQPTLLAWRIPWTEEPDVLQSMGRRVGHDWSNLARRHVGYEGYELYPKSSSSSWINLPVILGSFKKPWFSWRGRAPTFCCVHFWLCFPFTGADSVTTNSIPVANPENRRDHQAGHSRVFWEGGPPCPALYWLSMPATRGIGNIFMLF